MGMHPGEHAAPWRRQLYTVIFGTHTRGGRAFDVVLLWLILLSVAWVMLESVASFRNSLAGYVSGVEWVFTLLFTLEYLLRLLCVRHPLTYALSFFGVVDLLSLVPTYVDTLIEGSHALVVVRGIRLLRVFRVLKLARQSDASQQLVLAIRESWPKISVFLYAVLTVVCIFGTIMYLVEGEANGFTSIPQSIYWAIVTMTTVGYGDIAPQTPLGQALSAAVMILGYAIIAVPTGIVTAQLTQTIHPAATTDQLCSECELLGHDQDARYCKYCGGQLVPHATAPEPR